MKNNIMKYSDQFRKKLAGTAMEKSLALAWATIVNGLNKLKFPQDGKKF